MKPSQPETEMYYAGRLPGTFKAGIGRQILPNMQTHEEWEAAGSIIRDEPYDAYAISIVNRPNRPDIWSVIIEDSAGEKARSVEVEQRTWDDPDRYTSLASNIEREIGRTGLTIIVS